jgi:hypothetical protein
VSSASPVGVVRARSPSMARLFFSKRANLAEHAARFQLVQYHPDLELNGLVTGVDNLRHDVCLSQRFCDIARSHITRLLARHGGVEDLVGFEAPLLGGPAMSLDDRRRQAQKYDPAEFKRAATELHVSSLNSAKNARNLSIDLLARLGLLKFLRTELTVQFAQVLEKCRARLRAYDGPRNATDKSMHLRDRFLALQVSKKNVLRKAAQDIFATLREIEKETLARMRRSLFADEQQSSYDLFQNRLLFTDDGRDDYLNAEHYVMLGNYERDPDRYSNIFQLANEFFHLMGRTTGLESNEREHALRGWLSAPENARELVGNGVPEDGERGESQQILLSAWTDLLERSGVLDHIVASYEVVTILNEYSALINAQQLKNAIIFRSERTRVDKLLEEHGRLSAENLHAAAKRAVGLNQAERQKLAGRFLADFMRYQRDLRRFESVLSAMDGVNVLGTEKLRELSSINNTLYEFLLSEERTVSEDKVTHHVVLKADIRDSTTLTRTLFERGLNPASYFSLNFYEPVNKLLPKYGAEKVFIEGDAVILSLFEREGEASFGVARTCVLAREIIEIVRGYNVQSRKSGLPILELGIGISYQDSAPMYLMDGNVRIMISKALNESDRLSACSKSARRYLEDNVSLFSVFAFQTVDDADTGGTPEEFLLRFNVGGIHLNESGFRKLASEISLQQHELELPVLWKPEPVRLFSGTVPLNGGVFHKILLREGNIPRIDARDFSLKQWTDRKYYEVCTSAAVYEHVEVAARSAAAAAR